MSQLIDAVAPLRFGRNFRRLLLSSWAADLGDGVALAAGPLLVVSQTREPWGVTGPFWFGFVGSFLTLIAIWRRLADIATVE